MNKLIRQDHRHPDFNKLDTMLNYLKGLLSTHVNPEYEAWKVAFEEVLDFQDDDGSFNLLDSFKVVSDARVDFCYMPTYICTAIIMKAYMKDESLLTGRENVLKTGLRMCCGRSLSGHGYGAGEGRVEALRIFMKAGLREFLLYHPDMSPDFTEMIEEIRRNGTGDRTVDRYLNSYMIFVYGTLLTGEHNHGLLESSTFVDTGIISGYTMYDTGSFPAIVPGDGIVKGEVYEIDAKTLERLDWLEGEGSLYKRISIPVQLSSGESVLALVYEYLCGTNCLDQIPEYAQPYATNWKDKLNNYVWYVSYGSNMCLERFRCYIKGGSYCGSKKLTPCVDSSDPVAVRPVIIPYDMYFGNYSSQWEGGVSFLDSTKPGNAYGVAYLITREQYEHVARQENGGALPEESYNWYNYRMSLGEIDGIDSLTLTNKGVREYNDPSERYLDILRKGISDNFPEETEECIEEYLRLCSYKG